MTETDLQRSIKQALEAAGFWVVRTATVGKRSSRGVRNLEPGHPDLTLVGLGYQEVKLPGGELSPDQVAWHERARNQGVNVATVTSPSQAVQTALAWRRLQ